MPKKDIDYDLVMEYASRYLKDYDIARLLDWDENSFTNRKAKDETLRNALDMGRVIARQRLYDALQKKVNDGDSKILIHLSKHFLGMGDNVTIKGDKDDPIRMQIDYSKIPDQKLKEIEEILAQAAKEEKEE